MKTIRYVVGADGGGTKTEMVLVSHAGRICGRETGGCANLQAVGEANLRDEILGILRRLTEKTGAAPEDLTRIALGLAGAGREADRERVLGLFRDTPYSGRIIVESDAEAALAGAFANRPGVILIAGTGSICFGKDAEGHGVRAGGWGYLLGDEGGGYFIGREALKAALRDRDGRGEATSLRSLLEERFREPSVEMLIPRVYSGEVDRVAIADLAPLVFGEARKGDPVAMGIVSRAGAELGQLVRAVSRRMKRGDEPLRVALIGSVFRQKEMLMDAIREGMGKEGGDASFLEPRFPPSVGAALMALERSGVPLNPPLLRELEATISRDS